MTGPHYQSGRFGEEPRQRSQNSNWATGWKTPSSIPVFGPDIYLFTKISRPALKPNQRPVTWIPAVLSQLKQPRRKSYHSPPPSAEVKNEWSYTSTPPIRLHGVERANFTIQVFVLKTSINI